MSRDQKPGKVRVVGGGGDVQHRRRADDPPAEVATIVDEVGEPGSRKSTLLLPTLFVSGCAIGGAALPLLRAL